MTRTSASAIAATAVVTATLAIWTISGDPLWGLSNPMASLIASPTARRAPADYPVRLEIPTSSSAPAASVAPLQRPLDRTAIETKPARTSEPAAALGSVASRDAADRPTSLVSQAALAPLRFDIADFGGAAAPDAEGNVRTSKPVILAGNRLGSIELTVGRGASVSVGRLALASLIGNRAPALADTLARMQGDRVTLDALRTREVAVRYDALADAVIIDAEP